MNKTSIYRLTVVLTIMLLATALLATAQTTFGIDSSVPESLGTVQVNYPEGTAYVAVDGSGHYETDVPNAPLSVTINGQTVYSGVTGYVTLPTQTVVRVDWQGGSGITVWIDAD